MGAQGERARGGRGIAQAGLHQGRAGQRARPVAGQLQRAIAAAADALRGGARVDVFEGAGGVQPTQHHSAVGILNLQGGVGTHVHQAINVVVGPQVQGGGRGAVAQHNLGVLPGYGPGLVDARSASRIAEHVINGVIGRKVAGVRAAAVEVGAPAFFRGQLLAAIGIGVEDIGLGRNHHIIDAQAVAVGARVEGVAEAHHNFLVLRQVQVGEGGAQHAPISGGVTIARGNGRGRGGRGHGQGGNGRPGTPKQRRDALFAALVVHRYGRGLGLPRVVPLLHGVLHLQVDNGFGRRIFQANAHVALPRQCSRAGNAPQGPVGTARGAKVVPGEAVGGAVAGHAARVKAFRAIVRPQVGVWAGKSVVRLVLAAEVIEREPGVYPRQGRVAHKVGVGVGQRVEVLPVGTQAV